MLNFAAVLLILSIPLSPPGQIKPPKPQPPPDTSPAFSLVNRALPWNLPDAATLPSTTVDLGITPVTIQASHTTNYTTNEADLQDQLTAATAPLTTLTTFIDEVSGVGGVIDASGSGDVSTGLSPNGSSLSLYDFADQFGGAMATGFLWVRSVTQFNFGASATAFSFVFAALGWRLLVLMIKAGIQAIDAIMRLTEWVGEFLYWIADNILGPLN